MEEKTTLYWHFSTDPNGDWLGPDGTRYVAHRAAYWITPHGMNVGCPCCTTEQEAGAEKRFIYDPLNVENEHVTFESP